MDFNEVIGKRYSVRKYSGKPVEKEKIDRILKAADQAPTGKDLQCQRLYVLQSEEAIAKIRSVCMMAFDAPVVILVCGEMEEAWVSPFTGRNIAETDTAIVTDHMMLEATNLGLGTCWVGYFDPEPIKKAFGIPEGQTLFHILPLGYPAEDAAPGPMHSKRKGPKQFTKIL